MTDLAAYRPYWHPIASSAEVDGQPRRFTLLGENLVAFRSQGTVAVFKDLCIHRGTALSLGRVIDGVIECPYHGWQYDAGGTCVRIPSLPPGQSIPRKARAIPYPVREEGGLVWVALEDPIAPFPDWPAGAEFGNPKLRSHFVMELDWPVGAGRATENFLDVSHFPFVHENTLAKREDSLVREHDIDHDGHSMHYRYPLFEPADPQSGGSSELVLEYFYTVPFACHLKRLSEDGSFSVVSQIASPTTEKTTRLFVTCVRNFNLEPAYDSELNSFFELVFREDERVVASQRPEEIPVDLREELHLKVPDATGLMFRRFLGRIEGVGSIA